MLLNRSILLLLLVAVVAEKPHTIKIDGKFDDWDVVLPAYTDPDDAPDGRYVRCVSTLRGLTRVFTLRVFMSIRHMRCTTFVCFSLFVVLLRAVNKLLTIACHYTVLASACCTKVLQIVMKTRPARLSSPIHRTCTTRTATCLRTRSPTTTRASIL